MVLCEVVHRLAYSALRSHVLCCTLGKGKVADLQEPISNTLMTCATATSAVLT